MQPYKFKSFDEKETYLRRLMENICTCLDEDVNCISISLMGEFNKTMFRIKRIKNNENDNIVA